MAIELKVWATRCYDKPGKGEQILGNNGVIFSTGKPKSGAAGRLNIFPGWIHGLDVPYRKFRKNGHVGLTPNEPKKILLSIEPWDL